ncbi:MAG: hypothetical protein HQM16_07280 [Deltaproteobacteria bacterium]|nr:hypothetical protein [Deltaproteobacteria bacterium]
MKKFLLFSVLVSVFLFIGVTAFAGQGYIINNYGAPVLWDASATDPIAVHPEGGACGRFANSEMLTRLTSNLGQWANLTDLDLAFSITSGVVEGVDYCNYTDYLAGVLGNTTTENTNNIQDNVNPVLFDNDGEIIDAATGESNGRYTILGFANPSGFSTDPDDDTLYTGIVDGQALFNCYCLEDADGNPAHSDCGATVFTTDDLDFTMIHEMGHFMNLDHTQINDAFSSDDDAENDDELPTMYPVSISAGSQLTPMEDDIVAVSSLYPADSFFTSGNAASTYCLVTGTLLDRFGDEMRCADIQAIDSVDNTYNVAFVSGAYAPAVDGNGDGDSADTGECTSACGGFQLYLRPGRTYALQAASINNTFIGGSGISPCANAQHVQCDSTITGRCTDNNTSTECRACVDNETLVDNDNSEVIAAKISAGCTAGATVALGDITGGSVSSVSAASKNLVKKSLKGETPVPVPYARLLPGGEQAALSAAITCPESGGDSDDDDDNSSSSLSGCSLRPEQRMTRGTGFGFAMVMMALVCLFAGHRAIKAFSGNE